MKRMRIRPVLLVFVSAVAVACGGAASRPDARLRAGLNVPGIVLSARGPVLAPLPVPTESDDELARALSGATGEGRAAVLHKLALLELHAAEASTEERARRAGFRKAVRRARQARELTRDAERAGALRILELWALWRAGRTQEAETLARTLKTSRNLPASLVPLAWFLHGETLMAQERWRDAEQSYRYLLGTVDHPLYPFGLLRSADCLDAMDRDEEARRVLGAVAELGCRSDAAETTLQVSASAAGRLGIRTAAGADGVVRPVSCGVPHAEERGEDERPPAFQ